MFLLVDDDEVCSVVDSGGDRENLAQNARNLDVFQRRVLLVAE